MMSEAKKAGRRRLDAANRVRNALALPVGSKRCPRCNEIKDYDAFAVDRAAKDGRQVKCRECSAAYYKENRVRIRAARNAYYEIAKDRLKPVYAQYRKENRDKINATIAAWAKRNKEKVNANRKEWRQENPDRVRTYHREWYRSHPLTPEQKAAKKAQHTIWRATNKDKVLNVSRNRRARVRNAEGEHTVEEIAALLIRQKHRCANPACRVSIRKGYHADHILPLVRGGSNWIRNIQLLCRVCNLKKKDKHPVDWARLNGLLL